MGILLRVPKRIFFRILDKRCEEKRNKKKKEECDSVSSFDWKEALWGRGNSKNSSASSGKHFREWFFALSCSLSFLVPILHGSLNRHTMRSLSDFHSSFLFLFFALFCVCFWNVFNKIKTSVWIQFTAREREREIKVWMNRSKRHPIHLITDDRSKLSNPPYFTVFFSLFLPLSHSFWNLSNWLNTLRYLTFKHFYSRVLFPACFFLHLIFLAAFFLLLISFFPSFLDLFLFFHYATLSWHSKIYDDVWFIISIFFMVKRAQRLSS